MQKRMKLREGTGVKCKNKKPVKLSRKPPGRFEKEKSNADFGYVLK